MKLGDYVIDIITGFEGVLISKHQYLYGCTRWTVQPNVNKKGALPSCESFDEPQLKVTHEAHVLVSAEQRDLGGPEKYSDVRRS